MMVTVGGGHSGGDGCDDTFPLASCFCTADGKGTKWSGYPAAAVVKHIYTQSRTLSAPPSRNGTHHHHDGVNFVCVILIGQRPQGC